MKKRNSKKSGGKRPVFFKDSLPVLDEALGLTLVEYCAKSPRDQYEYEINIFCERLKEKLIQKYRKGREEHGGSPVSVNCQAEINLEVLDILNYHLIDKVNARRNVSRETKG